MIGIGTIPTTPQLTAHALLFGDKLERTIEYIVGHAYNRNTRESYREAYHQLWGILRFLMILENHEGPRLVTATIAIGNVCRQLQGIYESEEGRL